MHGNWGEKSAFTNISCFSKSVCLSKSSIYAMGQQIPVLLTTWVFRFTSICVHDLRINDTAIFSLFLIKNYYTFEQGSNIEITKNSPKSSRLSLSLRNIRLYVQQLSSSFSQIIFTRLPLRHSSL